MNFEQILTGKTILFGFLLWLIPFVVGFFTFPVKNKWPLVFKTIVAVVLVFATVGLMRIYFVELSSLEATQGLMIGVLWAAICIAIDIPVFIFGFKTPAANYFLEIGMAYLMVPAITWGGASLVEALLPKA